MRKVKFNKWKYPLWDLNVFEKTGSTAYLELRPDAEKYPHAFQLKAAGYEENFPNEGYFHAWSSLQQTALALIEDGEGFIYQIPAEHIKFIDNPEILVSKETANTIDEAKEYGIKMNYVKTADGNKIPLQNTD